MTPLRAFSSRCTSRQSGTGRAAPGDATGGGNSAASSSSAPTPSGSGQPSPAASARRRYSPTVEDPAPTLAAISLMERPSARRRRTSLIFLIGSLFPGTRTSST